MSSLSDHGFEIIKHPIKKVRVQFHDGSWYVEYQRPAKYFVDGWWWFDDSKYPNYPEAFVRAQTLAAEGGTSEVRRMSHTFNVNVSSE